MDDAERELKEALISSTMIGYSNPGFVWLTEWHRRHSGRKVSRETIRKLILSKTDYDGSRYYWDDESVCHALTEELYALINGEQKKEWCRHAQKDHTGLHVIRRIIGEGETTNDSEWITGDDWICCPICGKPRPEWGA